MTALRTEPVASAGAPAEHRHRYDIDLIRLFCGASIMLGHTGAVFIGHVDHQPENGSFVYWAGHLAEAINPWAVPTYFAIAGWAVLSGAPPKSERAMLRRIWRHLVPLGFWTAAYIVLGKILGENERPMITLAFGSLFNSGYTGVSHLWYLYSYIPLITVLALAVLFLRGHRPWILTGIAAFIACAPILFKTFAEVMGYDDFPVFSWGLAGYQPIYAVIGAFLLTRAQGPSRWRPLWLIGLLACAGAVLWYETQIYYPIQNANPAVGLMCFFFIMVLSGLTIPERYRAMIKNLAGCAFGAYLIHMLVIKLTLERWVSPDLGAAQSALLLVGSFCLTFVISYALSYLWGKIPGMRKIAG